MKLSTRRDLIPSFDEIVTLYYPFKYMRKKGFFSPEKLNESCSKLDFPLNLILA